MRLHRATTLALVGMLIGCGGSDYSNGTGTGPGTGPEPTCTPTATRVCMTASTFDPTTLTVSAGTRVTWQNGSSTGHTVTSNPGSGETFDESVGGNSSFSFTFNTAGTYGYHCRIHGSPTSGMHGTIIVQ